jgi:U3 small nucleolar RNA-associated protein 14
MRRFDVYEYDAASSDEDEFDLSGRKNKKNFKDEEIDEDLAFAEDDYEKYPGFNRGKSTLPEFDEEEEEDEENGMDLSEMIKESDQDGEEDDDDDEEEIHQDEEDEDDEDDDDALGKLKDFVDKLATRDNSSNEKSALRKLRKIGVSHANDDSSDAPDLGDMLSALNEHAHTSDLKLKLSKMVGDKSAGTMYAPLGSADQARIERSVGMEKTAAEMSKWETVIAKNKSAESISFPLKEDLIHSNNMATLVSKFEPSNDLEKDLRALREMYSGVKPQIDTSNIEKGANMKEMKETQRRIAEMRSILFFQEIKAKHKKKIKSKAYHKRMKKGKGKDNDVDLEELDNVDHEAADEERINMERERAEARVSLRQQKSTNWMKQIQKFSSRDDAQLMGAIKDHSRLSDSLKSRMESLKNNDESFNEDESKEFLQAEILEEQSSPKKGLHAMNFMKKAAEKRKKEAELLLKQMESDASSSEDVDDEPELVINKKQEFQSKEIALNSRKTASENEKKIVQDVISKINGETRAESSQKVIGLTTASDSFISVTKPKQGFTNKAKDANDNINPFTEEGPRSGRRLDKSKISSSMMLDTENVLQVDRSSTQNPESKFDLSSQKTLVEEAFDDDIEFQELQKEKNAILDEEFDSEQIDDGFLPGWGSWVGEGVVQRGPSKKQKLQKEEKLKELKQKRSEKRQKLDNGQAHVLINAKLDKKAVAFRAKELPSQFKTKESYEQSLAHPLGKEWNTASSFRSLTKPEVITKSGRAIDPITWQSARKLNPSLPESPSAAIAQALRRKRTVAKRT